jgi:hypothetical protein
MKITVDRHPFRDSPGAVTRRSTILGVASALLGSCRASRTGAQPAIQFTRIPQADEGGREKHDIIEGRVSGAHPGQQIVLYARSGVWWIQPLADHPFTKLKSSKFSNATHLGTEYAALLVEPGYQPPDSVHELPSAGGAIAAVVRVPGQKTAPSRSITFAGYEWRVRDAPSNRGGDNFYDPGNAWTDANGALHLRVAQVANKWTCAEVSLTRSLGYGTYSVEVNDTSHLELPVVFSMFTYDYAGADENYHEAAVEISRWGDPASKNSQYVIQPYYVPANVMRFESPPGPLVHSIHWQPGRMTFKTTRASKAAQPAVAERVFTSGVPTHSLESIRLNLYLFRSVQVALKQEAEVVIDKFQFLP